MRHRFIRRALEARYWVCVSAIAILIGFCAFGIRQVSAQNQPFSSGSTGADGPLSFTTASSTPIYFDPTTIPNHHAGDTIFNFTTITIAQGVTVRLDSQNLPGPVYWLATGDVNIAGTLDLTGGAGYSAPLNRVDRLFSIPGAGGFAGGPGGGSAVVAEPGSGPGGGAAGTSSSVNGFAGTFSGSQYLIPLVGGSGGGGLFNAAEPFCGGGGAGGGAVLIASSTSITITGVLNARGGIGGGCVNANGIAGGGSSGAIRLMANAISVPFGAEILVDAYVVNGSAGFARLESFQLTLAGTIAGPHTTSTPNAVALPATGPSLANVVSVGGIAVSGNPFVFPSVTINTSSAVPVVIQAQNVPVGSIPKLTILSETGPDQIITAPALQGTFQSSTSTVNITYPPGGSRGLVRVSWTN